MVGGIFAVQSAEASLYDFNDGTSLDGAGITGTMIADDGVTIITTSDIRGHDGSLASDENSHTTNITGSGKALGVNSATTPPNAAADARDFDPGEAWIFSFNTNVFLNSIDLASLHTVAQMTISAAGISPIVINDDGSTADVYSLGDVLVTAGTLITFENTSVASTPETSLGADDADSHDFRISTLTVTPTVIPEPATLGLLGVCAIGAFAIRRFRM